MNLWDGIRIAVILGPIALMLILGLSLTLRSGVVRMASAEGLKRSFENASQTLLLLAGSLIGLAMIQRLVGLPVGLNW